MNIRTIDENTMALDMPERVDAVNAADIDATIREKIEAGVRRVVFQFEKTVYMSSAGLRVLFKTSKLLQPVQGRMALCQVGEDVRGILDLSGFAQVLTLCATEEEALAEVRGA